MTDHSVAQEKPDPFAEIAAELRKVADDVETMVGSGLPNPRQFQLNIQPGSRVDDDVTARAVDAMAQALLGINGKVEKMSGGTYHYGTEHTPRGPLVVAIYQGVSAEWALNNDPVASAEAELAEREAELEKARELVARLRASRRPPKPLVSDETIAEAARVAGTWNEREQRWEASE